MFFDARCNLAISFASVVEDIRSESAFYGDLGKNFYFSLPFLDKVLSYFLKIGQKLLKRDGNNAKEYSFVQKEYSFALKEASFRLKQTRTGANQMKVGQDGTEIVLFRTEWYHFSPF